MAKMAVADGFRVMACTPHVNPGLYDYTTSDIQGHVSRLQAELQARGIGLHLVVGADVHLIPNLVPRLHDGRAPTLGTSRYFLLEPPTNLCPPNLDKQCELILAEGFRPIVTHPERFAWVDKSWPLMKRLADMGCLIQITASAITGLFGSRVVERSERFIREGLADIIASDAHDTLRRVPNLSAARDVVARWIGVENANHMVQFAPLAVLNDMEQNQIRSHRSRSI